MDRILNIWIFLPFLLGFGIYLIPRVDRLLALVVALSSLAIGLHTAVRADALTIQLMDSFGVTLTLDSLSGFFILTNAIVTISVVLYCWPSPRTIFFYMQTIILHGSLNAVFVCSDFISLYVALEVISISAFLLITYARTDRSIWVGLRYLFISNIAMLFYLVGAVLVYQSSHTFAFSGLQRAPIEAIALIFLGLLTKGGVFVSGLWLPLTHSEAATPVSALLSGAVVKTGIFPLLRCAMLIEELSPVLQLMGVLTALSGVICAAFEQDTKRTLAFSTVSQVGFALVAPAAAGYYVLTHGLAKAILFLTAGSLPSRQFKELQQQPMPLRMWLVMAIACLSLSGMPLLGGFGAKTLAFGQLSGGVNIAMNVAAVGTAIVCAKFLFLPFKIVNPFLRNDGAKTSFLIATLFLTVGLFSANAGYLDAYSFGKVAKAVVTISLGWATYQIVVKNIDIAISRSFERIEHLLGTTSVVLTFLFWIVLA
ncbi:MAG: cation:proton antiporter [Cyanobacteria bacterium P01_E01_bin.45]